MDRLEQYLDQVCRSIGGPRAMRHHIRQELREHLLDAVAQHQGTGLTAEAALARALEEFGKPEEVRSELEAAHGQRLLAVVIDKAIEWKEMTMKAKWLWTTWAHLALAAVITLEILLITFVVVFIIPQYQLLRSEGMFEINVFAGPGIEWPFEFLYWLSYVGGNCTGWLLLLAAGCWIFFEWRVRGENKTFIRLAGLGTAALGLMVVVVLMTAALAIEPMVAMPGLGMMAKPWAVAKVAQVDTALAGLEQALVKEDWGTMPGYLDLVSSAMTHLGHGPGLPSLAGWRGKAVAELRDQFTAAQDHIPVIRQAVAARNADKVKTEMAKFHQAFEPVREAAKRAQP